MTDNILTAALTLLLAGGTFAIGSELIGAPQSAPATVAMAQATLPRVEIVGRRALPAKVAVETRAAQPQRVQ